MKTLNLKSKDIVSAMRFDGSYHISEGTIFLKKLKRMPHADLISFCPNIFTAGRNKRVYTDKEKGFPYLSNSDVVKNNPFESCNYNSKKYGFDKTAFLKEGMILTGRVGAIGQTSYVTKEFEENQAMGSDNIIRIVAKDKKMSGYIYAFLVSKYGNALFNRLAAGGVQPYISEAMLQDIPIPILPEETQQKIHNLIVESAQLRVEANKLLKEATSVFDELKVDYSAGSYVFNKVKIQKISSNKKRFDANYNVISELVDEKLKNIKYVTIRSQASKIFIGPRSKRNYVATGVPFLSTSEMQKANPTKTEKFVNHKTAKDFAVREGWILTTRSGTLGDTIFVMPVIDNYAVSEDGIRIVIDENSEISNRYLFAFLKSNIGKNSLLSGSYGSVILHLNEDYVGDIKVPVFEEKFEEIERNVSKYIECFNQAIINENQAIDLIEKEIDQWQQL